MYPILALHAPATAPLGVAVRCRLIDVMCEPIPAELGCATLAELGRACHRVALPLLAWDSRIFGNT